MNMKLQNFVVPLLTLALLMTAFATATPVEAAASYNGVVNSGGRSLVSYRHGQPFSYAYQFRNRYYGDRDEFIKAFIAYLEDLIEQLEDQLDDDDRDDSGEVSVRTLSAANVNEDSATLRARLSADDQDEVTVYFEYGEDRSDLDEETTQRVLDDLDGTYNYSTTITDLDENEVYYYRAVAEDEDGDESYGSVYSFRTDEEDDSDRDEEPDLETWSARDITDDSAELRGEVDMNDFADGIVFFVYGEDEDQVADVSDDFDRYSEVDEDGDDLQKERVDNNLDGRDSYEEEVFGLDNDTEIYYSICVEYEDEEDDEMIECGDVEEFTTDD